MSRQPKNEAFAQPSSLRGANAAYLEEMQAQYERNPGAVSDQWRHFFASLQEDRTADTAHQGPSWAAPGALETTGADPELIGALTGGYGPTAAALRDKLQARAGFGGVELSPTASLRAIQDSIRALMLIRPYLLIR